MRRPYILVVDDNKITTKLMRRYLESANFEALEAFDGIDCLEKVAEREPDAIIIDIMMPRLDGFETVRALKVNPLTSHIPISIVTALNDVATQVKAVEVGADDFLTKPIEEKLVIRKATILTSLGIERAKIKRLNKIISALLNGDRASIQNELMEEGFASE
ncbi:MAG: response regulator [Ignavibacteria bacterium]|nr:response regulator [Ignavibacteria bacterium]